MAEKINPLKIIESYYPEDTPLRRLLLKHSIQVRGKALALLAASGIPADREIVSAGAMLHDIGICRCHAPGILCEGKADYIAHGILGAVMLREYGAAHGIDLEAFARICERHTGSGLTAGDVREQKLPIPERDYLPETIEEKVICLADKFFSKSGSMQEKSPEKVRCSMQKFGPESAARFEDLCSIFSL